MDLVIKRVNIIMNGVSGVLIVDGFPICATLERPWINNVRNVSCIPAGDYICNWTKSSRAGNVDGWLVGIDHVEGRDKIRIHAGNYIDDSLGCILLGTQFDHVSGNPTIGGSRPAVGRFLKLMQGRENISLRIINCES